MMMRPGDILGRIFFILSQKSIIGSSEFIHGAHGVFIHGAHSKQSSEFKRMFWGCASARNLGGNLFKDVASQEMKFL